MNFLSQTSGYSLESIMYFFSLNVKNKILFTFNEEEKGLMTLSWFLHVYKNII